MHIIVLANTILLKNHYSGGDLVFPKMQKYFGKKISIALIGSQEAVDIWKKYSIHATYHTYVEANGIHQVVFAPILYFSRTIKAAVILFSLLKIQKSSVVIYSSSDYFPDVFPAFLATLFFNKKVVWVGRVYHVIPLAIGRGNILFTLFSFLSQRLSFRLFNRADMVFVLQGAYKTLEKYAIQALVIPTYIGADILGLRKKSSFTAVSVGSIHRARGMDDLLPIWKAVVEKIPLAKLLIIGGGELAEVDRFKRSIIRLGLSKNIIYMGFIEDDKKMYRYISQCTLYLCPNREGGGMMPVANAMRFGIPTIAYSVPVFGEMYKKGYKSVALGDREQFSSEIIALLRNKKAYIELSKEAKKESKKYNWKEIAEEFLSALKKYHI